MSRLFDDAASQYLEYAGAVVSSVPLTMACWFKTDDDTVNSHLMCVGQDSASEYFTLEARCADAGDYLQAVTRSVAGGRRTATTSAGMSAGTWYHCCGVFSATNARKVYLNGGNAGTDANDVTPSGLNRTRIAYLKSLASYHLSGRIAWPGIWNVALTDAEVAELAAGAFPPSIRPASIVDLWDLTRNVDPETSWVGSHNLTVSGATYSSDDPAVAMPGYVYRMNQ
jgi:hypothetical protein